MKKVILKVGGMSCSACSIGLEKFLNKQDDIIKASVNLVLGQVFIEYQDSTSLEQLADYIDKAGFIFEGVYDPKKKEKEQHKLIYLIIYAILAMIILYVSMSHMIGLPAIPILDMHNHPIYYATALLVLTIPYLLYGYDLFKSGFKNLIHKTPNMDTLVSLGVLASFGYSLFSFIKILYGQHQYIESLYFESCAIIIFFVKLGRFVDHQSKEKTKEALKELVSITPDKALIKDGAGEHEVTIDEVVKGDILVCKPGMKIAVDGIIIDGMAHIDEAFITGESTPVKKEVNSKVIAGSMNYDGYILYRALKIGRESTISEIVRLVIESTNTKAPISRVADKVSGYFVPIIMIISFLAFLGHIICGTSFSGAFNIGVTVLVVACPCALGLATPLAMVVSIGKCAKKGILVKTSAILEEASKINTIVFDKTGTLTYGNLKIAKIFNYGARSEEDLIDMVSSLECMSTHPISQAFNNPELKNKYVISDFANIEGIGIRGKINGKDIYAGSYKLFNLLKVNNYHCQDEDVLTDLGCSLIYVFLDNELIGLIGVTDIIREDAKVAVNELFKEHRDVIMLTGDNEKTAHIIAKELGIKQVIANVLPKDKTKVIKDLMADGKKVCMVGDGVNDAPALASATIGISLGNSTDIATDSADVILMQNDLVKIPLLIKISCKTILNIKQNLFWAFFYNICMVTISIGLLKPFGIMMNPMLGALAMTLSSLTVVLNALRLKC